ncbi:PREDICTED: zinc finger protein 737-like isoform X1 [Cyphomyrmex costatus]|nr:PREDICTED: zinc finger protein 737-like isoform X1 [Cyphomyrmex costatus]
MDKRVESKNINQNEETNNDIKEDEHKQRDDRSNSPTISNAENRKIHHIRLYICKTCFKGFKTNWILSRHERTHKNEKPYQCEFCKYKCGQKVHLNSHVILKHKDDERFKSNKDLYSGGVSHKCGTCNKEFMYITHLRNHERTHTGEKPYQCEFCEKKFRQKVHLSSHVILKHKDDERFKSNKDLHAGGVLHKCETCNKEFKNKTQLRNHERTHTGEKPYQCEFCENKFSRKDGLIYHVMTKHKNDKGLHDFKSNKDLYTGGVSYKCGTCNKEFKNKAHLRIHVRTHTGEKHYQCEFCENKFSQKVCLTRHVILKHKDDERFKSNKDLHAGGVLHKCGTCNKEFKNKTQLRSHERTHTGEKPYQCEFCDNKFRHIRSLRQHKFMFHYNNIITNLMNMKRILILNGT